MYTLYSACLKDSNGIKGAWDSIKNFEVRQLSNHKNYRRYFSPELKVRNTNIETNNEFIYLNDAPRIRYTREDVEEILNEDDRCLNSKRDNRSAKYFKPIELPLNENKIKKKNKIIHKSESGEMQTSAKSQPALIKKANIKEKNILEPLNEIEIETTEIFVPNRTEDIPEKSNSTCLYAQIIDNPKKNSLDDIFLNYFLMNSFMELDKSGNLKLTQTECYKLFKSLNKALKLFYSKKEIKDYILNLDFDENYCINFNSFKNEIIKQLLKQQSKNLSKPDSTKQFKKAQNISFQQNVSFISTEYDEIETLESKEPHCDDFPDKKAKKIPEDKKSDSFKISFLNLFLLNTLIELDKASGLKISKKGAFEVFSILINKFGNIASAEEIKRFVDSYDNNNDELIDFTDFKTKITELVQNKYKEK